jgi:membrane-bound lytic murein transglycosylase B
MSRFISLGAWLVACVAVAVPFRSVDAAGDFGQWLAAFRSEAARSGISAPTLDAALRGIAPIPKILELDRRQPEVTMTFDQYLERVVNDARVSRGRALLQENALLLDQVSAAYGVPPSVIVALWGIETSFGANMGGFKVVEALATLAYDGRRSAYFRGELLNALRILDSGQIAPSQMLGSWAGAMGQNQFMPSSYLTYAVDFNGDGRRDIWRTTADVFASSANYLAKAGWKAGRSWGQRVILPAGFNTASAGLDMRKPVHEWQALGVRRVNGGELPYAEGSGSIILPGGPGGPAFLVHDNYRAIMKWNKSQYFATSVGILSDRIAAR